MNWNAFAFKPSSISDTRRVRVSPLGAVEARKLRIIYDLTFAGDKYRSSVNGDTHFSTAPPCELGAVFGDVCRQILYLQHRYSGEDVVMDLFRHFKWRCSPGY